MARYDRTIVFRKGVLKQLNTIRFYVMESRARARARDLRRQIRKSTHAQIPILAKLLVHYVVFCDKENRDLSSKIYRVSLGGIS